MKIKVIYIKNQEVRIKNQSNYKKFNITHIKNQSTSIKINVNINKSKQHTYKKSR